MWTKGWGGKHAGKNIHSFSMVRSLVQILFLCPPLLLPTPKLTINLIGGGVIVDKNGAHRAPFRFSLGKLNCFR